MEWNVIPLTFLLLFSRRAINHSTLPFSRKELGGRGGIFICMCAGRGGGVDDGGGRVSSKLSFPDKHLIPSSLHWNLMYIFRFIEC